MLVSSPSKPIQACIDIPVDSSSQLHIGLQIRLETDKESGQLLVAVLVYRVSKKLACAKKSI
jgi:hypothetical protein